MQQSGATTMPISSSVHQGNHASPSQSTTGSSMSSPLQVVQTTTKRVFKYALLFSLLTNILGLAGLAVMLTYLRFVIPSQDTGNIPVVAAAGFGALAAYGLFEVVRSFLLIRHGILVHRTLADSVFTGMLKDAAEHSQRGFARGMADLKMVRNFLSSPQVFTFFDLMIVPIFLLGILYFSPLMAGAVLLAMGIIALITLKIRKETKGAFQESGQKDSANNTFLQEGLRCQEAVRAMGMDRAVEDRWRQTREHLLALQSKASDSISGWTALSKFISVAMPVLIVTMAAWLIINNHMSGIGGLIVVKVLSMRAIAPVYGVVTNWNSLQNAQNAYSSLQELLSGKEDSRERINLPEPQGELKAEQISYSIKGQTIVRSLSLEVKAGDFLGVLGPMAAGKTTLALLLTGVLRPLMGKVRLDGADMFHWDQDQLGQHIGYLPQDVDLFPGTIAENVARLGYPDPEKVNAACEQAGLNRELDRLADGLETMIFKNGASLPGGLRQKIGLARALYGSPCLVVLDEPDANLDKKGIQDLLATIDQLKDQKTTLITITHRPDLMEHADKLLLLRDGHLVQYGPKADVLAKMASATRKGSGSKGPVTVKL